MQISQTPAYRKAFIQYLRRGTPIDVSLKAEEHPTSQYIWRTRGDDKVRPTHAANEGRIFSWDNPPETGNPGDDYGCRCTAEPYYGMEGEPIDDKPIEPVYPIETLLGGAGFLRGLLLGLLRTPNLNIKPDNLTTHGAARSIERKISSKEIEEAIKTARELGDVVDKIGKYGTRQIHYKGSNGVTVIVETGGRNAGKVITSWRH